MATDPPRDLTAERAAATLLGRMGLVGHPADAQFIGDILEFRRQTRREALREAAKVAVAVLTETAARWDDFADLNEGGIKYTDIGFMRASARRCRDAVKQLDRLASEGGK